MLSGKCMFEKYAAYGFEDFLQDENFVKWVQNPDPGSNDFWREFLLIFPYQRATVRRARRVVLQLGETSRPHIFREDEDQIWETLQESIHNTRPKRIFSKSFWLKAAAVTVLTAGIAGIAVLLKRPSPTAALAESHATGLFNKSEAKHLEKITNLGETLLVVTLPDSSIVKLQPEARLVFDKTFSGSLRKIRLTGEAFFEVKRNSEKPFIVYSNGLITRVLGTSFNIKADKDSDNVTVTVRTGKVSVFASGRSRAEDPETEGLILRPNQQVAYSRKVEKLVRSLVPNPVPVIAPEELQKFEFINAPVTEIFKALETAYDTEILFNPELLSECRLTSALDMDVSLFEKLDVICEAIDATYKVVDAQVVITGRKCL